MRQELRHRTRTRRCPFCRVAGRVWVLTAMIVLATAPVARAGGGPENVVVVVNADSWASRTVANEFIHLRQVPPSNVVYLSGLPYLDQAPVGEFRNRILGPVLLAIKERGLADQIDYIVYSSDLPSSIHFGEDTAGKKLPNTVGGLGSINGLTYLHRLVMASNVEYAALGSNFYFRRPAKTAAAKPWTSEEHVQLRYARGLIQLEKWAEAEAALAALVGAHPEAAELGYNLACCLARLNRLDEAMRALERAVEAGWASRAHTAADDDLKPLRDREEFKRLLEKMGQPALDVRPAQGFRSSYGWAQDGTLTEAAEARRYMLSTMLAVTSGRGNSVTEALEALRRSAAADGTAPKGTVYFMQNQDVRSTTRAWAFASAAARLRDLGVAAQVLEGVLPKDRPDVAGAVIGAADFNWKSCGSTILPGAICEHLTSAGGAMGQEAGQTPLSEFIRCGAAGASGTVTEPLAIQAKFPLAFMHVHYARGCTLAEAFYQSVVGPYQLLIVGDPLCRPWAKIPAVTVEGAAGGATVKGVLKLRPQAGKTPGAVIDHFELMVDGRRAALCPPGQTLDLDTTTLCDGYHQLRVVAVTADPVQTQGRIVVPITVNNRGHVITVTGPAEKRVAWDQPVKVSAKLPKAQSIRFLQGGRILARIPGEEGQVDLNLRGLGAGRVQIGVEASLVAEEKPAAAAPDTIVLGPPIEVEIVPPRSLPPVEVPPTATVVKGLKLTIAGGAPVVIEQTREGNWLAKAGLQKGQPFVLEGYFDVPADDVYQFQIRTAGDPTVEVDAHLLGRGGRDGWRFLPVALGAGTHHLQVTGRLPDQVLLDIRFGGPGSHTLGADRFRHAAAPPAPPKPAR